MPKLSPTCLSSSKTNNLMSILLTHHPHHHHHHLLLHLPILIMLSTKKWLSNNFKHKNLTI
ncbi:ORF408 [White spot syndrome virus]|uniref:ORF408 n=1 Tax=White spot syndrome virus TaxID=342409 RepID=A0A2D3I737_9VIRU|nr:ORF408 [White spot syndrome virus]